MRNVLAFAAGAALFLAEVSAERTMAAEPSVDVALVLAGDASGSMTPYEHHIEREGMAEALRDPAVLEAIRLNAIGRIAVTYVEWAGPNEQWQLVPWTIVDNVKSADAFAAALTSAPLVGGHLTSLSAALLFASRLFRTSGVIADRAVIDISGDGPNNAGPSMELARDAVVAEGVTVNGLAIAGPTPPIVEPPQGGRYSLYSGYSPATISRYFKACVIGGAGAFVVPVSDAAEISNSMRRKLVLEIAARATRVLPVRFMMEMDHWPDCDHAE